VETEFEGDAVEVRLNGPGELAPGEDRSVELDLTPTGTGPFAWTGGFRPPGRESSLDLGLSVVRVVAPAGPQAEPAAEVTDLELVSQGLRAELETAIDAIPLPRGAAVSLATEEEDDADWVVEGLVTRGLLRRGVRVLARDAPHVLRYRVADARVVYSTAGSSFGLFGSARRREARAVVYLRLEDAGQRVLWVRRLDGRQQDPAVSQPAGWLSAGEGFPQSRIEPDRRYLELGLSGAILGGLLFIFFAP
jgi:TolB-like protein